MMADKVQNRDYSLEYDVEASIDIDAILDSDYREYHYDDGKVTLVDKNYYTKTEVNEITNDFNKRHRAIKSKESIEARRKLARKNRARTLTTVACVSLVIVIGVMFAIVLYPQATLSELSRNNSDRKDEIEVLKKEILDAQGDSNGVTDMDSVRAQAMALGMQEPNANQVVNIPMPKNDRLISVVTHDSEGISDDAIERATENLKRYYLDQVAGD